MKWLKKCDGPTTNNFKMVPIFSEFLEIIWVFLVKQEKEQQQKLSKTHYGVFAKHVLRIK
jgi:hypothetical protein